MIEINFILGLAIYGMIWFLCLFAVLPFGVVSQDEAGHVEPGSSASAPVQPHMGRKIVINTLVAAVVYGIVYWLLTSGVMRHIGLSF